MTDREPQEIPPEKELTPEQRERLEVLLELSFEAKHKKNDRHYRVLTDLLGEMQEEE